jgi:hypothetical protein
VVDLHRLIDRPVPQYGPEIDDVDKQQAAIGHQLANARVPATSSRKIHGLADQHQVEAAAAEVMVSTRPVAV